MTLFGSDLKGMVKKAGHDDAWAGAGCRVGIEIWYIDKDRVFSWPKMDYGTFFGGNTYIILNTYKSPDSDVSGHARLTWRRCKSQFLDYLQRQCMNALFSL